MHYYTNLCFTSHFSLLKSNKTVTINKDKSKPRLGHSLGCPAWTRQGPFLQPEAYMELQAIYMST